VKKPPPDRITTDPRAEVQFRFEISIGPHTYRRGSERAVSRAYAKEQMEAFVKDALVFMRGKGKLPQ
jgi:hypothetical protein